MNQSTNFPEEEFKASVFASFDKAKISETTISQFLLGKAADNVEPAAEVLQQVIRDAVKMGFKVTPAYLQFMRTALPTFSTLAALGRDIPVEKRNKIARSALIWTYPSGFFQSAIGKSWHTLTIPQRATSKRISDYLRQRDLERAAAERASTCHLLFVGQ